MIYIKTPVTVYVVKYSDILCQRLAIESWTSESAVDEVQVIQMTSLSLQDLVFRIGLYGVYTGMYEKLMFAI